jgi:exosortase
MLNLAALAALAGALSVHLWPEWTRDPDLSHGLLMPVACAALLFLCRQPPAGRTLPGRAADIVVASAGAAALAALWAAGLLAASLDWDSPIVDFALAGSLALMGVAAVAAFSDRRGALVPFGWTSLAAAVLWPLCSPLPPGTYARLTLALQLGVSDSVMRALDLLGVAAHREGNIIMLAHGTVGIEEACSGIRSLVSCLFAGLLLSAALCRGTPGRVTVVLVAAPLAVAMNFLRSLALTLLVNAGVRVEGPVHDLTGYGVLLATAAILVWIAVALDRRAAPAGGPAAPPASEAGRPASQAILSACLLLSLATLGFFCSRTAAPAREPPVPDLAALLPDSASGRRVVTATDLYQFQGTLRTDHLVQRAYLAEGPGGVSQVTLYAAYWSPGQASVGLVGSHTPDACWPGAGWVARDVADPRVSLELPGRRLPPAEHRLFVNRGYPQHVWYWQLYGGRPVDLGSTHSVGALLRTALRFGFRRGEPQAFIRVSSNRPWSEISREPFLSEFFSRAARLGLY